jgi:hypothetical protein
VATSKSGSSKAGAEKASTDTPDTTASAVAAAMPEEGDGSYGGKAADLAARVRTTVDKIREQFSDLTDEVDDLQHNTTPTAAEIPTADGVRRIPMAVGEVLRALDGLNAAAADLAHRATS